MARRYPHRPLVQLLGKSEGERDALARAAAKDKEAHSYDPLFRQGAVAHFAGFWADESEDGAGDEQKASGAGWGVPCVCALARGAEAERPVPAGGGARQADSCSQPVRLPPLPRAPPPLLLALAPLQVWISDRA